MGWTPTYALPYPEVVEVADVPTDMHELASAVEVALGTTSQSASIPGEVKMWPGGALPAQGTYGKWVWADGAAYASATYPVASAHISPNWKTFGGLADPGIGQFRVPDLRGMTPCGMDAMPGGGARANRVTRAVSITLAGRGGEEYHTITVAEMPSHGHAMNDPGHAHSVYDPQHAHNLVINGPSGPSAGIVTNLSSTVAQGGYMYNAATGIGIYGAGTGVYVSNNGSGGTHENMPPTAFVPYIVRLDG